MAHNHTSEDPNSADPILCGPGVVLLADFVGLLSGMLNGTERFVKQFVVFRFMVNVILSSTLAFALELAPLTPSQRRFGSVVKLFASICHEFHESHLPSGLSLCRECLGSLGMVCNGMHSAVRTEGCNHLWGDVRSAWLRCVEDAVLHSAFWGLCTGPSQHKNRLNMMLFIGVSE